MEILSISDHLNYLSDLGVTAIWLNPVLENDMEEARIMICNTDYYKVDPDLALNENTKILYQCSF